VAYADIIQVFRINYIVNSAFQNIHLKGVEAVRPFFNGALEICVNIHRNVS